MESEKVRKRFSLLAVATILLGTAAFSVSGAEGISNVSSDSSDASEISSDISSEVSSVSDTTSSASTGLSDEEVEKILNEIKAASDNGQLEAKLNELIQKSILTDNASLKAYAEYAKQVFSLQSQMDDVNANIKALIAKNPELLAIDNQFQASIGNSSVAAASFDDIESFLPESTAAILSDIDESSLSGLNDVISEISSSNSIVSSSNKVDAGDVSTALKMTSLGDLSSLSKNEVLSKITTATNVSADDVASVLNGLNNRDGLTTGEILGILNTVDGISETEIAGIVASLDGVSENDKLSILGNVSSELADQYQKEQAIMTAGLLQEALDQGLLEEASDKAKENIDSAIATLSALERSKYTSDEHSALKSSSEEFATLGNKTKSALPEQIVMPNSSAKLKNAAIVYDGQLLISLDDVLKLTGSTVEYTENSATMSIQSSKTLVEITSGQSVGYVNDKMTSMPVPVLTFNGMTYMSVEFFAQAYGISFIKLEDQSAFVMYDNLK